MTPEPHNPITEISFVGGDRLQVRGDAQQVEATIVSAARGSIMELAWLTEAQTEQRVAINPEQVQTLRVLEDPAADSA